MKRIDKMIGYFSPVKALQRQAARKTLEVLNSGYSEHGASYHKKSTKGWRVLGGGAKEDIDKNTKELRKRSRDLYYGIPIATGALKTMRTNVVGSGLKLKSNIDYEFLGMSREEADTIEATIEREFALWADKPNCDSARLNNFAEIQQLAFLSAIMNGDSFAILPIKKRLGVTYDLRVQLIEADRVCTPDKTTAGIQISEGVETDKDGEVVAYHICNQHPLGSQIGKKEWTRVDAYGEKTGRRNVIHLMEQERIGQLRGVPILAPVIETLKQLGRYTDAELMNAVVNSFFTVFIETGSPDEKPFGEADETEDDTPGDINLGSGSVVALGEGEKANLVASSRQNTAFDGFINSLCKQIGAALEMPHDILLKEFNKSYSASRGALLEFWKLVKRQRTWLSNDFCQPIYEEWLAEAVGKGRILAPGFFDDEAVRKAYCGAEWCGPSQGQIDPLKEVNAAAARVANGFSTRAKETIELTGSDFNKNVKQRIKEEEMMRQITGGEETEKVSD